MNKDDSKRVFERACKQGSISTLCRLRDEGYPVSKTCAIIATKAKRIDVLQWIRNNGYRISRKTLEVAVISASYSTLKWLLDNNVVPTPHILSIAVNTEDCQIVELLYRRGCPVNDMVELNIAYQNNYKLVEIHYLSVTSITDFFVEKIVYEETLNCLDALRDLGYKFNVKHLISAIDNCRVDSLLWFMKNHSIFNDEEYTEVISSREKRVKDLLLS